MPSQLHEILVLLFRNLPELAALLARDALGMVLPAYAEARVEAADLTHVQPAEYRADLVVSLLEHGAPVFAIVVEVQLSADKQKLYSWPVYAVTVRARMKCPVGLLVVTPLEHVARWAAARIELGGDNYFTPWVIGPSGVPEVVEPTRAAAAPELAVLSAMAHGQSAEIEKARQIAFAAMQASRSLDPDRSMLYYDLVYAAISEAARRSLQAMNPANYEFQSEFAKRYLAEGRLEGRLQGRAETVLKLLALRFGPLSEAVTQRVRTGSAAELDLWTERVLSATSLEAVLE